MNDKELLELAAKAAGVDGLIKGTADGAVWLFRDDNGSPWNPLTDDGDALRLAAKLKMNVCLHTTPVHVYADMPNQDVLTDACYRRAIVRTAAEIGRNM